jgi:hypothetical protein
MRLRSPGRTLCPHTNARTAGAIYRRILVAQLPYGFVAALCLVSVYVRIAVIVFVQLNFAIAPRLQWLDWF